MLARDPGGTGLPELAFTDLDPAGVIDNCLAVARPLAGHGQAVELAREADGEVGDVDHLQHFATAFG